MRPGRLASSNGGTDALLDGTEALHSGWFHAAPPRTAHTATGKSQVVMRARPSNSDSLRHDHKHVLHGVIREVVRHAHATQDTEHERGVLCIDLIEAERYDQRGRATRNAHRP
jgi:hypothetical protein